MLHNFLEEQECEKKENKENEVESTEVQKVTESPKDPACKEVKTPNDSSQVEKPLKEIESSTDSKQVQESENAEVPKIPTEPEPVPGIAFWNSSKLL